MEISIYQKYGYDGSKLILLQFRLNEKKTHAFEG